MDRYIFHMRLAKSKKIIRAQQKYGGGYRVQQIVAKPAQHFSYKCKFFCVYKPYKESISKEQNTDHDLHDLATNLVEKTRSCDIGRRCINPR